MQRIVIRTGSGDVLTTPYNRHIGLADDRVGSGSVYGLLNGDVQGIAYTIAAGSSIIQGIIIRRISYCPGLATPAEGCIILASRGIRCRSIRSRLNGEVQGVADTVAAGNGIAQRIMIRTCSGNGLTTPADRHIGLADNAVLGTHIRGRLNDKGQLVADTVASGGVVLNRIAVDTGGRIGLAMPYYGQLILAYLPLLGYDRGRTYREVQRIDTVVVAGRLALGDAVLIDTRYGIFLTVPGQGVTVADRILLNGRALSVLVSRAVDDGITAVQHGRTAFGLRDHVVNDDAVNILCQLGRIVYRLVRCTRGGLVLPFYVNDGLGLARSAVGVHVVDQDSRIHIDDAALFSRRKGADIGQRIHPRGYGDVIDIDSPVRDRIRRTGYKRSRSVREDSAIRRDGVTPEGRTRADGIYLIGLYIAIDMQVERYDTVVAAVVTQRIVQRSIANHTEVIYRAAEQVIRVHQDGIIISVRTRQAGRSLIDRQGQCHYGVCTADIRQSIIIGMYTYARRHNDLTAEQVTLVALDRSVDRGDCTRGAGILYAQRQVNGRVAIGSTYAYQVIRIVIRTRIGGRNYLASEQIRVTKHDRVKQERHNRRAGCRGQYVDDMQLQYNDTIRTAHVLQRIRQDRITAVHRREDLAAEEVALRTHHDRILDVGIRTRNAGAVDSQRQYDHTILAADVGQRICVRTCYGQYLASEEIALAFRNGSSNRRICTRCASAVDRQGQHDDRVSAADIRQAIVVGVGATCSGETGNGLATEQIILTLRDSSAYRNIRTLRAGRSSRVDGQVECYDRVAACHVRERILIFVRTARGRETGQRTATEEIVFALGDRSRHGNSILVTDRETKLHDGVSQGCRLQGIVIHARRAEHTATEQVARRLAERGRHYCTHCRLKAKTTRHEQQQQERYFACFWVVHYKIVF